MKSIIMSGNHPKLILDGIKTMSRRVIKPQPMEWQISSSIVGLSWKGTNLGSLSRDHRGSIAENYLATLCPYGQVGDRLWVRENWEIEQIEYPMAEISYVADVYGHDNQDVYIADKKLPKNLDRVQPSIHMFKDFSRITLEITEVRAERLQEITEDDVRAEGYDVHIELGARWFVNTWDSLNAKQGYSWETNPWNWVIGFKEIQQESR